MTSSSSDDHSSASVFQSMHIRCWLAEMQHIENKLAIS